jgi:hypothetical protein
MKAGPMKAGLLAFAVLGASLTATPASAHHYRHGWSRLYHVAEAAVLEDYRGCDAGWWQTLRFGHVRPYWGLRCR